eukprot:scaffold18550_cov41-Prasinocladus_malaysianus.AAC.2
MATQTAGKHLGGQLRGEGLPRRRHRLVLRSWIFDSAFRRRNSSHPGSAFCHKPLCHALTSMPKSSCRSSEFSAAKQGGARRALHNFFS